MKKWLGNECAKCCCVPVETHLPTHVMLHLSGDTEHLAICQIQVWEVSEGEQERA